MPRKQTTTSQQVFDRRNSSLRKQFGRRLQAVMHERNMSQSDLTRLVFGDNSKRPTVNKWINGISLPNTESIALLAKALDVEPTDLLPFNIEAMPNVHEAIGIFIYELPGQPGLTGVAINKVIASEDAQKVLEFFTKLSQDATAKAKPKRKSA